MLVGVKVRLYWKEQAQVACLVSWYPGRALPTPHGEVIALETAEELFTYSIQKAASWASRLYPIQEAVPERHWGSEKESCGMVCCIHTGFKRVTKKRTSIKYQPSSSSKLRTYGGEMLKQKRQKRERVARLGSHHDGRLFSPRIVEQLRRQFQKWRLKSRIELLGAV